MKKTTMRSRHAPLSSAPPPPDPARPHALLSPSGDAFEQLGHWLGVVRRQWLVIGVVWLLVMAAAAAALAWWPRAYTSTAKFLVRNAREELVVNPGDRAGAGYRDGVTEETVNSEIELLRSRDILTQVVKELRLNVAQRPGEDPELVLERAVRSLSRSLSIGAIRKTNLIQVVYESSDPRHAASVLRHLSDAYLAVHLSLHSSPAAFQFFVDQTEASRKKWDEAQQELSALARSANLIAPEEQRKATLQSATELEAELAKVEAEIGEQSARARSTDMQMGLVDSRIVTQTKKVPNQPSVERLHTLIVELKNKRTQLLTKFNSNDRLVTEVDEQLKTTEAALADASSLKATEEATDLNPSWQSLQTEQVNTRLALAGLTTKATRMREQLRAYQSRAVTLTEAAPRYESLLRRVNEARAEHELYAKRAEEARVDAALDKQKISNVVLAEAPVASHIPSSPRVRLSLVVAAMLGALLAAATALVVEWRRARTPEPRRDAAYRGVARRITEPSEAWE
jgi:uncharacterized protein involved in exopolysaccharide biosynthesis